MQHDIFKLTQQGWFFDLEMDIDDWIREESIQLDVMEDYLMDFFRDRVPAIQAKTEQRFHKRSHIIRGAFNAYLRGEHELAIPVLFTQIDGICYDEVKKNLFIQNEWESGVVLYRKRNTLDWFTDILLDTLTKPLPISLSQKKRDPEFSGLNRHQVIHGESVDYGTEINALKTISLLNYIYNIFTDPGEPDVKDTL